MFAVHKRLGACPKKNLISSVSGDRPIASSLTLVSIFRTTWSVLANEGGMLQSNNESLAFKDQTRTSEESIVFLVAFGGETLAFSTRFN